VEGTRGRKGVWVFGQDFVKESKAPEKDKEKRDLQCCEEGENPQKDCSERRGIFFQIPKKRKIGKRTSSRTHTKEEGKGR